MVTTARVARRLLIPVLAGVLATAGLALAQPASAAHPAGPVGKAITLATQQSFDGANGYDVATSANGTAYIGWISGDGETGRRVHLCTLPAGGSACSGGVQIVAEEDNPTAADLRVLSTPDGHVTLLWFHNTTVGVDTVGEIAEATALHGLHLTGAHNAATAPANGELLLANYGPHGQIWTVAYASVTSRTMQLRRGLTGAAESVHVPFAIGSAQLAFTGGKPVMTVEQYGSVSNPPAVSSLDAQGRWRAFAKVPKMWPSGGMAALVTTSHGVRLVADTNDASYRTAVAHWNGTNFVATHLTADSNSCGPSSHDGSTDASGRLLDASWECNQVTVLNYQDGDNAAVYRITVAKTGTYAPQIASNARGLATLVYSYQDSNGSTLVARHLRLPDYTRSVSKKGRGGRIVLRGPASCLPAVQAPIGIAGHHAKHWHVASKSMHLGSKAVHGSIDGAALTSGHRYTLHGAVKFKKGTAAHTVRAKLTFVSC